MQQKLTCAHRQFLFYAIYKEFVICNGYQTELETYTNKHYLFI